MEKQTFFNKNSNRKINRKSYNQLFLVGLTLIITLFSINLISAFDWNNQTLAYWNADTNTGGKLIDSLEIANFTKVGATAPTTLKGIINNGTSGNNDGWEVKGLSVPASYNTSVTNFTINFWVNITSITTSGTFFVGSPSAVYIQHLGTGRLRLDWNGIASTSTFSFTTNKWYMISIVQNGSDHSAKDIYVNGIFNETLTTAGVFDLQAILNDATGLQMSPAINPVLATMDEIGIFNKSLTASEITDLYNSGAGITYGGAGTADVSIQLNSPSNNSIMSNSQVNFTAYHNITGTNENNYTWKNVTYNVWYSNGTLFNQSFRTLYGNNTYNTTSINSFIANNYKWNVLSYYGNDTFTNSTFATNNNTFSVGVALSSLTYNTKAFETSSQTFTASFNILTGSAVSVVQLVYNGTTYSVSNIAQGGDTLNISKTINIPLNSNKFGNVTNDFYFRFTYSGSLVQTSSTYQQDSAFINLQRCNGTWYEHTLNFTLWDEGNLTKIVPTTNPISLASTFRYWLGDGSVYKNYSYQLINSSVATANNFTYCIYPYQPTNYTFKTDLDSIFSAQDYTENEYYLRNATLTNNTGDYSLYLYTLLSTDATKFYVTVKQGITFVSDAVVTISKYFTGTGDYKTTSIKITDNDGEFPAYLDLDNKYLFSVVKDGVLLGILEKTASCSASPCSIELNLEESIGSVFRGYDNTYASNVYSNLSFNPTTKMVTYTFVDITGLANYFRLLVKKVSYNGTIGSTICNEFAYTSAGSLTCNLTGYTGDFYATGYISRSPELIDKILGFIISDTFTTLGFLGIFLNIAIIITVILSTAATTRGNPSAIIFMLGLTILLLKIGNLFPFSWAVVVPLELVVVWALMKVKS